MEQRVSAWKEFLQVTPKGDAMKLLTITEAAALLRCSRTNLYKLIDDGELPVITVGHSKGYRLDLSDLIAFVENRKNIRADAVARTPSARPRLKHLRF